MKTHVFQSYELFSATNICLMIPECEGIEKRLLFQKIFPTNFRSLDG